jgi:hypothetical protein
MESLPHHDCPCWRLTEPLAGNDTLPDNICLETTLGSVRAVIRDGVLPEGKRWPACAFGDDPLGPLTVQLDSAAYRHIPHITDQYITNVFEF